MFEEGSPKRSGSGGGDGGFMETFVSWGFKILTFVPTVVTLVIGQMLTIGAPGATFLGRLLFVFLVVLSADSYWQVLFQGSPLFPWYETNWIGWGWVPGLSIKWLAFPPQIRFSLGLLTNITFYMAVAISMVIQIFESAFVAGDKFRGINPKFVGLIAIAFWTFDIITTFTSRNPWRYTDPQQVLMCILFNIFTIACAELGRWAEKLLAGK